MIRDWWPADWPAFVAGQCARCVSEQRALSLPALGRIRFRGSPAGSSCRPGRRYCGYPPGASCNGTATSRGGCPSVGAQSPSTATSSGKTALSLDVCEAASGHGLRPVVLNADSRQVYAGLDIGTSKIKPPRMRGFEHRLLDVAEPSSKLSLEAYAQMARRYRLIEQARLPGRRRNVASQTHGYREFVRVAASTGKPNRGARRRRPRCRTSRSAQPHPGVLQTAAVVVPQTRRVASPPSISGESHNVASAVTAPRRRRNGDDPVCSAASA